MSMDSPCNELYDKIKGSYSVSKEIFLINWELSLGSDATNFQNSDADSQ